jgi:hypothetical protein
MGEPRGRREEFAAASLTLSRRDAIVSTATGT